MKKNMIEINLLPKELRKVKKASLDLEKIPLVRVSVFVFTVLVAVHILLVFLDGRNQIRLKALNAEWKNMEPEREKTGALTKNTIELEKRLGAIKSILEKGFNWTQLLNSLNNAVIPKIWLSELELQFETLEGSKKGSSSKKIPASISITGHALGNSQEATSIVARFITSLKQNKEFSSNFSEIELQNMRAREFAGKETMKFVLNCRLRSAPEKTEIKKSARGNR